MTVFQQAVDRWQHEIIAKINELHGANIDYSGWQDKKRIYQAFLSKMLKSSSDMSSATLMAATLAL